MEQGQMTINKTSVELYKIRHTSGMYWADITVDAGEKSGRIQIASDFGDWQNYWSGCGMPFKEFLAGLDIHYAADKFDADRFFDQQETIASFKRSISETRSLEGLTAEEAEKLYDYCTELEHCSHEQEFIAEMWHMDELMRFFDNGPSICRTISPGFKRFWDMVWPVFIEQLKQEADYCAECKLPYSSDYKIFGHFPIPTDKDLVSPLFKELFNVVKHWKGIRVPDIYTGTLDGNGRHAKLLLDGITHSVPKLADIDGPFVPGSIQP